LLRPILQQLCIARQVSCTILTNFRAKELTFSQPADQMQGHGIPNDFMQNFDPLAIIVCIPIMDRIIYPMLRRYRIPFPPINRIVLGFWVVALAMAYAAILQHYIYKAAPCFEHPLCLTDKNGVVIRTLAPHILTITLQLMTLTQETTSTLQSKHQPTFSSASPRSSPASRGWSTHTPKRRRR
jgi:dipeptide/tripeptide permease